MSSDRGNSQVAEMAKSALLVAVGVGVAMLMQRFMAPPPPQYPPGYYPPMPPQQQQQQQQQMPPPGSPAAAAHSATPHHQVPDLNVQGPSRQQSEHSPASPNQDQLGGSMRRRGQQHYSSDDDSRGHSRDDLHANTSMSTTGTRHRGRSGASGASAPSKDMTGSMRGDTSNASFGMGGTEDTFYGDREIDELENMIERSKRVRDMKMKLLRRIGPLKGAPGDVVEFLVDNMQHDSLQAGENFCVEGDYGDTMFIIAFGKAEVKAGGKMVGIVRDGDFFGEAAALQGCLRVATVKALARTNYFTISQEVLMECIAMWSNLKDEFEKLLLLRKAERKYSLFERRKPEVQRRIKEEVTEEMEKIAANSRKGLKWRKNRRIGGGAFGDVYSAIDVRTGEPLAVKTITIGEMSDGMLVSLERESEIMERLHHRNLVRGYGMQRDPDTGKIHIIMELVPLGSLQKLLDEFGTVSEAACRSYTLQMLDALRYLHNEGILHRDIKPANALIGADGSIKLADFGISRLGLQHQTQTISGTPAYLSPDAINGRYSVASDIWALGCTILQLVTGQQPWSHLGLESSTQIIFAIATAPEPYPLPEMLSAPLQDLLAHMLHIDPEKRTDCDSLMGHEWFHVPEEELPAAPARADVASPTDAVNDVPAGGATAQLTSFLVTLQQKEQQRIQNASEERAAAA